MLISEALEKYTKQLLTDDKTVKTANNYRGVVKSFIKANGNIEVTDINREHINRWKDYMNAPPKPLKLSTKASYLNCFRQILEYLTELGVKVYSPEAIDCPKVPRPKVVVLTKEEIARLMWASNNLRDKLLISLLFSTGCRPSEALGINWEDIKDNHIVVYSEKTKEERVVRLDERTQALLEQYLSSRYDNLAPLFVTEQDTRMTVGRAWQIVTQAAKKAGLQKRVYPYILRHSHATQLMENGVHLRVIQTHLGHKYSVTTERYTHVSNQFLMDSLEKAHKF